LCPPTATNNEHVDPNADPSAGGSSSSNAEPKPPRAPAPPRDPLGEVVKGGDEFTLCVVCKERAREVVFTPCGHLVACYTCGNLCKTCPICRAKVTAIPVHIS